MAVFDTLNTVPKMPLSTKKKKNKNSFFPIFLVMPCLALTTVLYLTAPQLSTNDLSLCNVQHITPRNGLRDFKSQGHAPSAAKLLLMMPNAFQNS